MDLRNTYIVSGLALVEHLEPNYVVGKPSLGIQLYGPLISSWCSGERFEHGKIPPESSRC